MTVPHPVPEIVLPDWGKPLTESDYAALAKSWITSELANAAMLRRVDEQAGREIVGQKGKRDCAGILIPYYWPGDPHPVNYRIRRDRPDLVQVADGTIKEEHKYLGAPGAPNRLYIPPGICLGQLADVSVPIIIVEGEKKALALWRLANDQSDQPRFIAVAIPGVWSWRGVIGKTAGPNGERLDVKGAIPDLSRIAWNSRTVFILFDRNVHTNASVKAARTALARHLTQNAATVKFVNLPEDCGVNGVDDLLFRSGPQKVLELFNHAIDGGRLYVVPSPQFEVKSSGIYRTVRYGDQIRQTQLTNFTAKITSSIFLDDGIDVRREFEIESELLGRQQRFRVADTEFAGMDWPISKMGPTAIIYPRQKDYAKTAIQSLSLTVEERRVYAHTGWRKIGEQWLYVHAGGAIGDAGPASGIEVRLSGALNRYDLGTPQSVDLAQAVRSSLKLIDLGPAHISYSLLAATFRAVLGEADFSLHVAGETGAYKSEIAALHQRFFGREMDRKNLPASWSSTANALETVAFQAKDALLVVDDFAPQGNASDVSRYHSAADRLFRAAGNCAGRSRLDSTARLKEPKPPRGLILSTGEEVPKGHSVRARILVLEVEKGSISKDRLTESQRDAEAGVYTQTMAALLEWIAGRYDETKKAFATRVCELRRIALSNPAHARTPEIVANLQAAFEIFLKFAGESGAIGEEEQGRLEAECWEALRDAAAAQAKHQAASEPTALFLEHVRSAVSSGRVHLASRDGRAPENAEMLGWRSGTTGLMPHGDRIGWIESDAVYLDPVAAFRVVQFAGRDSGEMLAVTMQTLKKRLKERGLLASVDDRRGTNTVRRVTGGCSRDVLHFDRATLFPDDPEGCDAEADH